MAGVDDARSPSAADLALEDDEMGTPWPPREPFISLAPADSQRATPSNTMPTNGNSTEDEEVQTPSAAIIAGNSAPITKGRGGKGSAKDNKANESATKIRHLKKDDGEPLWRVDIQYDFLKIIFDDDQKVFTNSYDPDIPKQTFADLYIDAMARSSKTSKILRDKLYSDREPAKNMAMVCLLVNLGRMNTTLNFFPEMRAQLRTYHAIPSLQAHQDPNSYKQLQDAPRLKSILKGASEDRAEPNTTDKIRHQPIPRTNPVNLIFVLANCASKVTQMHFPPGRDFFDLIMRPTLTSRSRATAFLWLMWFYLESDFTIEGAMENPFGAGYDYQLGLGNQGVPPLEEMSEEDMRKENVDPPEELDYGNTKRIERCRIIQLDQSAAAVNAHTIGRPGKHGKPRFPLPGTEDVASPASIKPLIRPSKYESDLDSTRSTPPPRAFTSAAYRMSVIHTTIRGRSGNSLRHQIDGSSPAPSGFNHIILAHGATDAHPRRPRPLTAHQLAVEANRSQRVNYILSRGLRKAHHASRKIRRQEGAFVRAHKRIMAMPDPFEDSEGESSYNKPAGPLFRERGMGGLVQLASEPDDFGEESASYAAAFRRMTRRLDRWDGPPGSGERQHKGKEKAVEGEMDVNMNDFRNGYDTEDDMNDIPKNAEAGEEADEDLDDFDKELLGLGSEGEEDEDLDDMDKSLLGIRGDETEVEEGSEDGMDLD